MIRTCNKTLRTFESLGATIVEGIDMPLAHMPEIHPALYFDILSQSYLLVLFYHYC